MYIRQVTQTAKKTGKKYHTYRLVEAVRTERGARQRLLLNLGSNFSVPKEYWKELANRIEEILSGQKVLFTLEPKLERIAHVGKLTVFKLNFQRRIRNIYLMSGIKLLNIKGSTPQALNNGSLINDKILFAVQIRNYLLCSHLQDDGRVGFTEQPCQNSDVSGQ